MRNILLGLIMCMPLSAEAVMVSLLPSSTDIHVGDVFSVDIVADIGAMEPVLGWGLDIQNPSGLLTQTAAPVIGSDWFPASGLDGDGLAGLAFPMPVTGNDILLASLTYEAIATGVATLMPSYTLGDFTEGFPLAPPNIGFADIDFTGVSLLIQDRVISVPEPGTALTILLGLVGMGFFTRETQKCIYVYRDPFS